MDNINLSNTPKTLHTPWGNARLDSKGYYIITSRKKGYHGKLLHRLIYEKFWGVELIPQIHIHHKDGVSTNNCILNLEAMLNSDHSSKHNNGEIHPFYGKNHSKDSKYLISKSKNTSGFFRVSKRYDKNCSQGFRWTYSYLKDGKPKTITRVDLNELKKVIISKGLEWRKL